MRMLMAAVTDTEEMFEAQRRTHPELEGTSREEAMEWAKNTKLVWPPTGHLQAQLPSFGPILDLLARRSWTVMSAPKAGGLRVH